MTEEEWKQSADAARMLGWLESQLRTSQRKLRLFVAAACRQVEMRLRDPFVRLVHAAEDAAEYNPLTSSAASKPAQSRFHDALLSIRHSDPSELEGEVQQLAGWAYHGVGRAATCGAKVRALCPPATPAGHAALVREVFGNPFRKIRRVGTGLRARVDTWPGTQKPADILFVREWLTWERGLVPRLAEEIHNERAFCRLGHLADALEDAGCMEPGLLEHLREPYGHVRGCWALDLLLGRE